MNTIKNNILGLGVLLLATSFIGCSEDYLNKEPNGSISKTQLSENSLWNPNVLLGQAAGVVSTSFTRGTGGTTDHDDFGQKSVDIATDLMSGDMVMSGETYAWFSADSRLLNNTTTKTRAYEIWRYYYQIVRSSNSIFDVIGGDGKMPAEGEPNRVYYGQAKVLRAYAYFNLVNLYAKPYAEGPTKPALPIYKSQLTASTAGLSTVDDVYNFIIADLKEALVALNGYKRTTKDQPNASLAQAYLAYVYLSMGDYENAAKYSADVISSGSYSLLAYENLTTTGFSSIDSPNWIWGINLTKDNTSGLPTFWGQVDYFTYSYCAAGDLKMIPDNVYAAIPATDKRKLWFSSEDPNEPQMISLYKFYDAARTPMGDRLWTNDEVYMRIEEMYLVNAEANARANHLPEARTALKSLLDQRDPTVAATVASMNQDQLLDEIYYNWRVELWAEGRGLLTMKRFKKTVTRGSNDFAYPGESFSYNDSRFTFEIPEAEVNNNPNLK